MQTGSLAWDVQHALDVAGKKKALNKSCFSAAVCVVSAGEHAPVPARIHIHPRACDRNHSSRCTLGKNVRDGVGSRPHGVEGSVGCKVIPLLSWLIISSQHGS